MAQARKKPAGAKAGTTPKPRRFTAAKPEESPVDATETPEAVIRRLAEEVKKFSGWWHEDRLKVERLERRVRSLEGTLRAISNLARVDVGDFVERCDRSSVYDDNIPF